MPSLNSKNDGNEARKTSQYIDNISFDTGTDLAMVEIAGPNSGATQINRALVGDDGSLRVTAGLTAGIDYDYLDVQQTDADTETYVFKTGGSGGTTVRTVVVTYTSSSKSDIDTVEWS